MTDISVSQVAVVTLTQGTFNIAVSQVAAITLTQQVAEKIVIGQVAVIQLDNEYQLPTFYTPFFIPCIWGSPVYIER